MKKIQEKNLIKLFISSIEGTHLMFSKAFSKLISFIKQSGQ